MDAEGHQRTESEASEDVEDDDTDTFSAGSEDDDDMFDMFTGGLKGSLETSFEIPEDTQETMTRSHNAASSKPYEYGSLKAPNNIRVLDIEPSEDPDEPISASLRLTSLSNPCLYYALSYAWGR